MSSPEQPNAELDALQELAAGVAPVMGYSIDVFVLGRISEVNWFTTLAHRVANFLTRGAAG